MMKDMKALLEKENLADLRALAQSVSPEQVERAKGIGGLIWTSIKTVVVDLLSEEQVVIINRFLERNLE